MEERFRNLASIGYGLDFNEYLVGGNKALVILRIDEAQRRYTNLTEVPEDLLRIVNDKYFAAKAGYAVDAHISFKFDNPFDILLISQLVLESEEIHVDTILIHELAHWAINSGQRLIISPEANELGQLIYRRTDIVMENRTQHTLLFCQVLAQGCINYNTIRNIFANANECIEDAMRFDIDL